MERFLGIDIGSISLKAVVLDTDKRIAFSTYRYTEAKPRETCISVLREIEAALNGPVFSGIIFTGSGKTLFTEALNFPALNEIIAHARSCWEIYPEVKSIIEIGGQDSKFIRINTAGNGKPYVEDFQFNGLCSAGTGAFLDQQSERLGISIEEFSKLAYRAETVPLIAGRCSVFAKSDMIHLQQQGTDKGPIAAGLCFALARNYLATLCKGRNPRPPIAFQGGVAANRGMIRAFAETLGMSENEIIVPDYHKCAGAYGAALEALKAPLHTPVLCSELLSSIQQIQGEEKHSAVHPPFSHYTGRKTENSDDSIFVPAQSGDTLYLGLDIGSVSTKGVLLNSRGKICAKASVATRSEPVRASADVLEMLEETVRDKDLLIGGFYTTGSGRHLVKEVFEADAGVDEITAHSRSAAFYRPEADTIFEIGGQDSKFIRLEQGALKNFIMNRLCAAGTGSFLEEQAGRLSINIESDFSESAFKSKNPVALGTRCTVFMDSDLVHHIQRGESIKDLCAGLAYSIVENYLENLSTSMDLGNEIIFQGGVANNKAVHAAFESYLKRPVALHPAPTYAGAVGAALLAIEEMRGSTSAFSGFRKNSGNYTIHYHRCEECPNRCSIMSVQTSEGRTIQFGSICGKHNTAAVLSTSADALSKESPFRRYHRLLTADYLRQLEQGGKQPEDLYPRGSITIPLGLTMFEDFPFWSTFFRALGYRVRNSGGSTAETAREGKERLPVETCMPVRMLFGHAWTAGMENTDYIFIPHTPAVKLDGEEKPRYLCPYTQTIGYIARNKVGPQTIILGKLLAGSAGEKKAWIHRASRELGIQKNDISKALDLAIEAEKRFYRNCRDEGKKLLENIEKSGRRGLVLLGRPYVVYDGYLNMDLAEKIRSFGMEAVPPAFLPSEEEEVGAFWDEMHWEMGIKLLKAASYTYRNPALYPVLCTSFGCGPDGFIVPFLEDILGDSPRLVLEFDENRIDTGLITRIEAFGRSISENHIIGEHANRPGTGCKKTNTHPLWRPDRPLREYDCYIPYFSDHAYAYAGALRAAGCKAEVLPSTSERSFELARQYASGNECHPFLTILGDLLRLAEEKQEDAQPVPGRLAHDREAIYYSPKYIGSCLINAYETSMQLALDKMGVNNVHLLDFGNLEHVKELGLRYPYYLAMSAYAIDRLTKWAFEIAPYEEEPGRVMEVHKRNMTLLTKRMGEHRLMKGIRETARAMRGIALSGKAQRPAVGVAGDVFTRINPAANFGLFDKLQQNGFDTMASALIMDVVLYRYEQLHQRLKDDGKPLLSMAARMLLPAISLLKARVDRFFPEHLCTPQESQFPEVYERTKNFIDYRVDNLISLNLNRIYELHHAGAEGILNVMCPNCMVGTMSEAFFPELKEEKPELPITSLSFGDQQETHIDNRLEAFMHLVKEGRKKD